MRDERAPAAPDHSLSWYGKVGLVIGFSLLIACFISVALIPARYAWQSAQYYQRGEVRSAQATVTHASFESHYTSGQSGTSRASTSWTLHLRLASDDDEHTLTLDPNTLWSDSPRDGTGHPDQARYVRERYPPGTTLTVYWATAGDTHLKLTAKEATPSTLTFIISLGFTLLLWVILPGALIVMVYRDKAKTRANPRSPRL